ncbi:MAG: SOS response-associated peptidase [Candidatus Latescibacteria bacterium]|nr:SOS response-associated peptidase [Candidatus Latescibacterota bacterium]
MCGRYTLATDADRLRETFPDFSIQGELPLRYNIAPSQDVAVVANIAEKRVEFFRWGLIPSWAKDPGIGDWMINARAESLAEKPSFRTAYRQRRCLILTDGFYEWYRQPGSQTKTPIYIRLRSGEPFAFAGLWDVWRSVEGPPVRSCTIITTVPNELVGQIHNRMPVILKPETYEVWLDPSERSPDTLSGLLTPYPTEEMTAYPVSPLVNNPRTDTPTCITPTGEANVAGWKDTR